LPVQQINLVQVPLAPTSNQNTAQATVQIQPGSSNQKVVQTSESTTTTSTTSSNPTSSETPLNEFKHFSNTSEPLYQFALQAMDKINSNLAEKGFKQS
jgi:hypothetical protein